MIERAPGSTTGVDAAVRASRVFVAIAVASLEAVPHDLTLPQYRALVVLEANGPQDLGTLAGSMGIGASSASRMVDRLVGKDLVDRALDPGNRRHVVLALTAAGRAAIAAVVAHRRSTLQPILARMGARDRDRLGVLLDRFTEAAQEVGPWRNSATL